MFLAACSALQRGAESLATEALPALLEMSDVRDCARVVRSGPAAKRRRPF
jgi:hypothetical protein